MDARRVQNATSVLEDVASARDALGARNVLGALGALVVATNAVNARDVLVVLDVASATTAQTAQIASQQTHRILFRFHALPLRQQRLRLRTARQ